jgi:hypothetical protein
VQSLCRVLRKRWCKHTADIARSLSSRTNAASVTAQQVWHTNKCGNALSKKESGDTLGNKTICVRQNQNAAHGTIIRQEPRFRSDGSRGGRSVQTSNEERKPTTRRKRAAYDDTHTHKKRSPAGEAGLWRYGQNLGVFGGGPWPYSPTCSNDVCGPFQTKLRRAPDTSVRVF